MQANIEGQETKFKRKTQRNLKSATKYPKKLTTYIVAFALNDNNIKCSNLTPNKQMSPTTSSQNAMDNASNEIKNEHGYTEVEVFQTISNIPNNLDLNEVTSQPLVLFNAQRHTQNPKFNTEGNRKKINKHKRVVTVKNIYFKNKHLGNMTRKLKIYYKKAKYNCDSPRQIQKGLYHDTITKRVSRTPVLRKVLAKENLLEETNKSSIIEINVPDNNDGFFICSPLEGNSSFVSGSSQGTLTRQDSLSSGNYDVTTTNSVIRIKDLQSSAYKTDIINVAVAQINNTPILNRKSYSVIVPHKEAIDFKESLTSTETTFSQTLMLTSSLSFEDATKSYIGNISDPNSVDNSVSNKTLIPSKKRLAVSCDTFVGTNSNSDNQNFGLNHACDNHSLDISSGMNDLRMYDIKDSINRTQQLYDNIINISLYPKATPCSSSVPDFPSNNNVIIAEDILKTQQLIQKMKNRGDEEHTNVQNDFHSNIFQKPLHAENPVDYQKNLNLPNVAQLTTNMLDPSRTQRKCSEEARDNYPTSFPELFDKLTIVLEIAVKKLEKTLSDKIENELKKSFHELKKLTHPNSKSGADTIECLSNDIHLDDLKKSNATIQSKAVTNKSLQCDIIQNEEIDKLTIDFTNEIPKYNIQSSSSNFTHKLKKPKLLRHYYEELKAPLPSHHKQEEGKGDSVQISVEDAVDQQMPRFDCTKTFFSVPATFIRENMIIIASVPAFLFVLFVIYSYVILILRMW